MGSNRWWFLGGDAISLGFIAATVPLLLLLLLQLLSLPFTRRTGSGGDEWFLETLRPFRF
jgi:hypothetical protein